MDAAAPVRIATGGCLCGAVRYRATGEPLWVAHCHCHSCRRHSGGAVATFAGYRREQVAFHSGAPGSYASSPGVRRGFCRDCGTPLSYEAERCPDEIHLYIGTLDDPAPFAPGLHVFFAERVPWLELHDDLPRFAALGRGAHPIRHGPRPG